MDKRELRKALKGAGEKLAYVTGIWNNALDLFYPGRSEASLRDTLKKGDIRTALWTYVGGGFLIFLIAITTTIMSVELSNFASDTLSEVTGEPPPHLDYSNIGYIAMYQFILYVPLSML